MVHTFLFFVYWFNQLPQCSFLLILHKQACFVNVYIYLGVPRLLAVHPLHIIAHPIAIAQCWYYHSARRVGLFTPSPRSASPAIAAFRTAAGFPLLSLTRHRLWTPCASVSSSSAYGSLSILIFCFVHSKSDVALSYLYLPRYRGINQTLFVFLQFFYLVLIMINRLVYLLRNFIQVCRNSFLLGKRGKNCL